MARSASSILVCVFSLLTTLGFAQKAAPQDDNTNSPAMQRMMQEQAQERAERKATGAKNQEVEEDDPTARAEWQRHAFGVHTQQSLRQLLQQRAAQTAARQAGV